LLRYYQNSYDRYTTANGLPDNHIPVLHVDRAGAVWIGTERGGITRWAAGQFQRFPEIDGVPLDHVVSIKEDASGTLWVNAGDRFVTIAGEPPGTAQSPPAAVPGALHMALQDRAGAHWFSRPDGIARAYRGTMRVYGRGAGVPARPTMIEDPGGGYWLGTNNDGLFFFQPQGDRPAVRHYPLPDGRREYRVRAAYAGLEGDVWFGTNANGLIRAKRNLFTVYTTAHGLSHDVATAIYADQRGTVWAATNCFGVNAIDQGRGTVRLFKPRRPGDPAGDPCVFAMTEAPAGTMWFGTWGGGLTRITGAREQRLKYSAGLRDSVVLALFTDRGGTVWVGTNTGGLAALHDGRVRAAYTTDDGLAHNSVRTIYQTRDGALWIGALEGLSRFADGRFTTWRAADGLSTPHVRAIYEDAGRSLWIGTYGGGLNRFRDGVFTAVTREDGLADDVVSSILEDDQGYFWMSGNQGISRVARSELTGFAEGRLPRVHAVLYGPTDGLLNAETNGGFQPAAWKDARGHLWFPTVEGVAVVDPGRVTAIERTPSVTLEEVVVDGVARPPAEALVVGPGRPNLEFRYTGLSLATPQHVTFRYRLEGFDDDWVLAGTRRIAYYPRLEPGQYRFVVTAANRDGAWDQAGTSLRLRVATPFWNMAWFRLAAVAGLLGIVVGVMRRREMAARRARAAQEEFSRRLLESQEHERKRIAGELHDGLGQELLVIKNRALLALGSDGLRPPAREQLRHITDVVTQSLENVRGLAHNLTPYQLDHLGLSAALRAMIEAVADTTEISLAASVDDVDDLLPVEGQINLYRIAQEGLSNVVRHSAATTARIEIRRAGDSIDVTIADDGRGFPVRQDGNGSPAGGFGLSGIAERARILRGKVEVVSAPGQGTRIVLSLPIGP
jgi:signal transduction histidine kinase/ligand-binding sensor domain-containing protein